MEACQLFIIFLDIHFTNSIHCLILSHLYSKLVIFQLLIQKDNPCDIPNFEDCDFLKLTGISPTHKKRV